MTRAALLASVALSAAMIVFGQQAAVALGDKAEAGSCAIATTGSASGNSVTCNFNMPPEKLKELIEAALKGGEEPILDRLVQVSKTLGVTEDAAKTLLKIVGEDPTISADKLAEALTKVAGDYKRLQARVAALNPDNPTARALVDQAKPEIEVGHFARARELLGQATQAEVAAAQEAYKIQEQARASGDAHMLGAARLAGADGDAAMTERHYAEAAELFVQAAGYVPIGHASKQGVYLRREADALAAWGEERGDNDALTKAIDVYGRALQQFPRSQDPQQWVTTQNNLGEVLTILGDREMGTQRLEQAVVVFRATIEEATRERDPLRWALIEHRLGYALERLGERESGTARLEEAVRAFRAALEEATRERDPQGWAMTQTALGIAFTTIGSREVGTARLEEAVEAYRAALIEYTRERDPPNWAVTQNNLGVALTRLG